MQIIPQENKWKVKTVTKLRLLKTLVIKKTLTVND